MTPEQRALRDALAAVPARAAELVAASGRDPDTPLAPGEWSAREVVLHFAAVDELWHGRLDTLASIDEPHWPWADGQLWAGHGDDTIHGAMAAFVERRSATIARVDALSEAGWRRIGHHDTFGTLDAEALLRVLLDHDDEHLTQLGRG